MKTKIKKSIMIGLAGIGLWLNGSARAQITLHDGGLNCLAVVTNGGGYTISTNFTVTSGASVMVVSLWDRNTESNHSSPSFGTWSNTTAGTVQTLTRAVSINPNATTYSDSDIYYLYNPSAGSGKVTLIDTNGSLGGVTIQGMTMQLYDLSGVNTNSAPAVYATNSPTGAGTNLSVVASSSTPAGAWAGMIGYDANSAASLTNSANSGNSYYVDVYNNQSQALGYVTNLAAGSTTFKLTEISSGGSTKIDLAVAVFSPAAVSTNVTPQFSNLSSHTITVGTTNVTLSGTVSTNGQYLPNGTVIKVTINSNTQQTTIDDSTGDFSLNYNTTGFATNVYTATYTSAAAAGFNAATNTSTTLTITAAAPVTPQFSGLSSPTTTYGTTDVSLSGTVSTNGQYLPNGTTITVTVDGNAQHTTISGSVGDFNLGYDTVGIPASGTPYTVTYTSAAASGFNPATNTSSTMTINQLPVVLSGSMVANGTTTVPAADLTVSNLVDSDNLTLSGSVTIASTNVGVEAITSFSGLTLGGTAAANYTLTGASGTVTLTSGTGSGRIALQNGSLSSVVTNGNLSSISATNFTVTSGASVLVVSLYDRNQTSGGSATPAPASLAWGSQTLTRIVSQSNDTSHFANSVIYYLFNPAAGTQTITATDTNASVPSALTMQVYTLSGVNTAVAPVAYQAGTANTSTNPCLSLYLTNTTPAGAWAVVNNSFGDSGGGSLTITSSSGTTNWVFVHNNQSQCMGAVSNLAAGASTIAETDTDLGAGQQTALVAAIFAPGSGGGITNVTPQFSNLSSHTIPYGTTNVTLTGTVSTNGLYLPDGTAVTVTINGNGQQTTIDDSTGDFSLNYNTTGFATNVYTVTYTSAAASGFNAATNTSTTLTITATAPVTPQFSGVSSPTTTYGTTDVSLSGTVSTNGQYLPNGTTITVTVDGNAQQTSISGSVGDFNIGYSTVGIPASATPYTVTYTSAAATGFNPATNTSTTMTINQLPVVLTGSMVYDGSTTVPASDLTVSNRVDSDNLTLSGSVTVASTNLGSEAITSFSGLTLGGTAAANYTLTGASGSVTITAGSSTSYTNFVISPPIRTASPTELVLFLTFTNVSYPWYQVSYPTNLVTTSSPGSWKLNGTPVQAISGEFVTEDNGTLLPGVPAVEYHIYLQVPTLTNGMSYTLVTPYSTNSFVFEDSQTLCESIKVNQNGYSGLSTERYANLAIWLGSGGSQPISGTLPTYTVFDQTNGAVVASGTVQKVATAQPDTSSGDYVYQINLSSVPVGGPYQIDVAGYGCSYPFGVGGAFSQRLAYVAFRALYYQRCGCPIVTPYAHADIRPGACHTNIYDNESPDDPSTSSINVSTSGPELNVHGGYHDAGDTQKNPDCLEPAMALMTMYEVFPGAFTSNQFNIPAGFSADYTVPVASNGIPDVLNEACWALMLFTNLQSTPHEPSGAVADGVASDEEPPTWAISWDEDTLVYSTETNNGWECSWAACAFMNYARLIKPYNSQLASAYAADAEAAYAAAGSTATFQHQLYYNIQKYFWDGDVTASNNIESLAWRAAAYTNTYDDEASGFANNNGQIWMASEFMTYLIATNYPKDPNLVLEFSNNVVIAANQQIYYMSSGYPVGWPTNVNPWTQNNYTKGPMTSQAEYAYPCLMAWYLTGQQQYINAASVLMDYDQGLNPMGKCYMTSIGFNRVNNPHDSESAYAEAQGWGGPQPGISIYGPGENDNSYIPPQIPAAVSLPREREWMDDVGNYQWSEFTDYQSEGWPAAVYPVLAGSGVWNPTNNPFIAPQATNQVY